MRRICFALLCMLPLALSCGGGDDDQPMVDSAPPGPDAPAAIDAPPPAPDANVALECETYCDCMDTNCIGSFADHDACLAACGLLDAVARDCRTFHCSMAVGGGAATHCPHARGESMCD